jgi:hypothetical protein
MLCTALIYCRDQVKEIETFLTPAGQGVDELKITTILTWPTAPVRCIIQAGTSCDTVIVPAHTQLPQTEIWIVSHSEISEKARLGNSASRSGLLNLGHARTRNHDKVAAFHHQFHSYSLRRNHSLRWGETCYRLHSNRPEDH